MKTWIIIGVGQIKNRKCKTKRFIFCNSIQLQNDVWFFILIIELDGRSSKEFLFFHTSEFVMLGGFVYWLRMDGSNIVYNILNNHSAGFARNTAKSQSKIKVWWKSHVDTSWFNWLSGDFRFCRNTTPNHPTIIQNVVATNPTHCAIIRFMNI